MSGKNCKCPVELFSEDEARQRMRHGHGPEGKKELRSLSCNGGPAVCRSDRKDEMLGAVIAPLAKPAGEDLGTHTPSATIEKDGHRHCSALKLQYPFEQGFFVAEGLRAARRVGCAAFEIEIGKLSKAVPRPWSLSAAGANVRHGQLHGARILQLHVSLSTGYAGSPQKREVPPDFGICPHNSPLFHIRCSTK